MRGYHAINVARIIRTSYSGLAKVTSYESIRVVKSLMTSGSDKLTELTRAVFNTVIEPLVVLDSDLRIVVASRSFYQTFQVSQEETADQLIYEVGDHQWDIPELRMLLEKILPERGSMDGFEVDREFPGIGQRTMSLTARRILYDNDFSVHILLALNDITSIRAAELEKDDLLRQKDVLLQELQHRVANSLSIIASILLLKARTVQSEETRVHLEDAHKRVLSVAAVQNHLHAAGRPGSVHTTSYLTNLCESLADSMTREDGPISVFVEAAETSVSSAQAVSLGLIVTELVINAIKHAFPHNKTDSWIRITYQLVGAGWKLTISDNGVGADYNAAQPGKPKRTGLGTSIVSALAQQLEASVATSVGPSGTTVTITHASGPSDIPVRA